MKFLKEYKDIVVVFSVIVVCGIGCYTFINNTWVYHMKLSVDNSSTQTSKGGK